MINETEYTSNQLNKEQEKSIYFASPLFSQAELIYNLNLTSKLEKYGFRVFLPQRDGADCDKTLYEQLTKGEKRNAIFAVDREKIFECDIFLFILDGRVPDEGACVELGIAYTHKYLEKKDRIIAGLHTDIRAAFIGSRLNPMLKVPLDYLFEREEDLLGFLKEKA